MIHPIFFFNFSSNIREYQFFMVLKAQEQRYSEFSDKEVKLLIVLVKLDLH